MDLDHQPPGDLDPFLESLALILTEESLEAVLGYGVRLINGSAGAAVTGLLLLRGGEIAGESWHPGDPGTVTRVGAAFRRVALAARDAHQPFAAVEPDDSTAGLLLRVFLPSSTGDLNAALCVAWDASTGVSPGAERRVERLGELLAAKIAAHDRQLRAEAERQRYERWFKTLDQQLRLLDRERQKFSAVVSQSDLYVFVTDVGCNIRWTNKAMSGFSPSGAEETWLARSCGDVCGSIRGRAGAHCAACPLARALETNEPAHQELHRGSGDAVRTFYLTALPIRGPDGSPNEVMVMMQDLTDLRVLRKSESRYRRLFERSASAIVMVRPSDHRILLANSTAGRLLGAAPEELAGLALTALHGDAEWSRIGPLYARSFVEAQPEGFECALLTRRGEERSAVAFATHFDLEDEEVVMLEYLDVTDRRRAEQALWQREEQLRQSQKMEAVGKLAGGVAHDFNNLLSVIMGRIELVLDRLPEHDPSRSDLMAIHTASTRGAWLIRQLLAFSRQEIATPEVLDLRTVVDRILDLLRSLIGEKIELETVFGDQPVPIRIDRAQLEQVLVNLVINARDAMPHGGRLTIAVDRCSLDAATGQSLAPGDYASLAVADTGHGMDEDTRARLFEPFFTTKEQGRGSGLGLSVVYGVVTRHRGHVTVSSERGQGTTVRALLPLADGAILEPPPPAPATVAGRTLNILIVEDNDAVRAVAREALEMDGYHVIEAPGGSEALEICNQWDGPLDLVISDVVMPRMSGGELIRHVARIRPETRLLLISGYTDDAMVRHGIESGVPFLQKPFSLEALARRVREVLAGPAPRLDPATPRPAHPGD